MLDADSRRETLHRRLNNTQAALRSIARTSESFPDPANTLAQRVDELIDFARESLDTRWRDTEGFPEPGRELVRTITCDDFLRLMHELSTTLLPALRGSNSTRVPVELYGVVRDASTDAANAPCAAVMYAKSAYNYSVQYYGDPIAELAPRIAPFAAAPTQTSETFVFLSLPELERDSATLHCVMLGHEIGHLRDWTNQISSSLNVPVPPTWLDAVGQPKPEYVDAIPFYRTLIANWAQELVADIFAALLYGPASLFAILELLVSVTTFEADTFTHPAGDRRSHTILGILDAAGAHTPAELAPALAAVRDRSRGADSRPVRIEGHTDRSPQLLEAATTAWQWLLSQVPTLQTQCVNAVARPWNFSDWPAVEWAAAMLDDGMPCGEKVVPGTSPSVDAVPAAVIMNGAWVTRLRRHPNLAGILGIDATTPAINDLHAVVDGLVLKSREIMYLRQGEVWQ